MLGRKDAANVVIALLQFVSETITEYAWLWHPYMHMGMKKSDFGILKVEKVAMGSVRLSGAFFKDDSALLHFLGGRSFGLQGRIEGAFGSILCEQPVRS